MFGEKSEVKMATTCDLPPEVMMEIFSRMSAKSIGKCRCLSKSWNSHLSTKQFINSHLNRHKQQNLLFINQPHSLHTITSPIQNNVVSNNLQFHDTWIEIGGSCNGLVLLVNNKWDLCLLNPLTTQKVHIPDSHFKKGCANVYGFGYDTCSDDYKIIILSLNNTADSNRDTFVYVYSVKRGVWKRVDNSYTLVCDVCNGAFLSGAIHWLNMSNPSIIAAFDLANEVFYEIPTPAAISKEYLILNVMGERLCLVGGNDVWTMEEYGSVESWIRLCSFGNLFRCEEIDALDVSKLLCFIKGDEIVLSHNFGSNWAVYNVKEGTAEEFIVDGVPANFRDERIFFDSLVSLG